MSLEYTISANPEQIADAISLFEFIGGNTDDAMRIAINKTAPKVRTAASSAIREQVRLKAAYVKEKLTIYRATRKYLRGSLSTRKQGDLLSRYSTDAQIAQPGMMWGYQPPTPTTGIKVRVKPGGSVRIVQGDSSTVGKPFYMKLKDSNAIGIAARRSSPTARGGRIKVFYGPSVDQVFDDVRYELMPAAADELQAQLVDAMRYILVKKFPPEPVEE